MVFVALPIFNQLTGLAFSTVNFGESWFLLLLGGIWLLGTFLSGLYPAWVWSSFKPVTVLKGEFKNKGKGLWLRKGLAILQFTASVALIAGTFIIYHQLNHIMNRDIGMNIDQVLVVKRPSISPRDHEARNSAVDVFIAKLAEQPDIQGVAASVTIPGKQREYKANVFQFGKSQDEAVTLRFNSMDYNFMDIFDMKLIAGRKFLAEFPQDQDTSCIITESAVQRWGFKTPEDALGKTVSIPNFRWNPIIVCITNCTVFQI